MKKQKFFHLDWSHSKAVTWRLYDYYLWNCVNDVLCAVSVSGWEEAAAFGSREETGAF